MTFRGYLGLIALTLLISSCSAPTPSIKQPVVATPVIPSPTQTRQLLELARASTSPQQEQLYLQAAEQLAQQSHHNWARNLLTGLDSRLLSDSELIRYTLLLSKLAIDDSAYFLAQRILTNPRLDQQWQTLPTDTSLTLRQRRAKIFAILGEEKRSIEERLTLGNQLAGTSLDSDANRDAIWQTLMALPLSELQQLSQTSRHPELQGWYSLALIGKNNDIDLEQQLAQVNHWVQRWPQHTASQQLPSDLQRLQQLIQQRPRQIALLLPQSGKLAWAGKAIRDGFLAAYYRARQQQQYTPEIRSYDSAHSDIDELYQRAVDEGAELIIGPLDKNKVADLGLQLSLPVAVLAMNYTDLPDDQHNPTADTAPEATPINNLFQFGLAAEDEARQAAQRAWFEGHRQAMLLAPASNWGERSATAFKQEWLKLGGKLVSDHRFDSKGNYSNSLKEALQINQSQDRARRLRRLFGQGLEFEPRRRQDIDMIFLLASPTQARQIKPTLAFHYAGELPVYATSHIYAGSLDRKSDRDLNDIKFSTIPWTFDSKNINKNTIDKYSQPSAAHSNLYALGTDAYRLYPRLKQLQQESNARLYGATGTLQLQTDNRIARTQVWAQIRNGRAQLLSTLATRGQP